MMVVDDYKDTTDELWKVCPLKKPDITHEHELQIQCLLEPPEYNDDEDQWRVS
jgi:hypothetical protein